MYESDPYTTSPGSSSSGYPSPLVPTPFRSNSPPIPTQAILTGRAWIFGDDINTDIIIPFKFKSRTNDPYEMAKYSMYGIDPDFHKKISRGDFIIAGTNFGGGSSREQAAIALKYAGIAAIVAESFARIFYRNAFSIGLPALEIPQIKGKVVQGDEVRIDIGEFTMENIRTKENFSAMKVPRFMRTMLLEGGLIEYYKKNKKFPWTEL